MSLLQSALNADFVWPVIASAAVKGAALLLAATLAAILMGRASAAARHWVWLLALCGTLTLPFLSVTLPQWKVLPTPPTLESIAPVETPAIITHYANSPNANRPMVNLPTAAPIPVSVPDISPEPAPLQPSAPINWPSLFVLVWSIGATLMLMPILAGMIALLRLGFRSQIIDDPAWLDLLRDLSAQLHVTRPIRLLQNDHRSMPMTWGIRRATILLPAASEHWPDQRKRLVLLHELAHVNRQDNLTHLIAQFARAANWFNPLATLALHRLAVERERACDDIVLTAGHKPSDYAEELLTVATGYRSSAFAGLAAIAMARPSTLENRMRAILDRRQNRRVSSRRAVCIGLIALLAMLLPLAALRTRAAAPAVPARLASLPYCGFSMQLHNPGDLAGYEKACDEIAALGGDTVMFVPTLSMENGSSDVLSIDALHNLADANLRELIQHARAEKLRVILMPIVLLDKPRSETEWRGTIHPDHWDDWFASYQEMISHYARVAEETGVNLLVVGSELVSTETFVQDWHATIGKVRTVFHGQLTYSSNWDHYTKVPFWDDLDIVGMNSYWKLGPDGDHTVSVQEIENRWTDIQKDLFAWQATIKKPIILLEAGWCSLANASYEPWDYTRTNLEVDVNLQTRLYHGFFASWWGKPQSAGFMLWDWTPESPGGPADKGYTPRGKPAAETVKNWFAKPRWETVRGTGVLTGLPAASDPENVVATLTRTAQEDIKAENYTAALGMLDQIVALDPKNGYALAVHPFVADRSLLAEQRKYRQIYDAQYAAQIRAAEDKLLPHDATRPSAAAAPAKSHAEELLDKVLPETNFDNTPFTEAIDYLRDTTGANIFVNWRLLAAAGIDKTAPISPLKLHNVKFAKALGVILDIVGSKTKLAYQVDNDVIMISTADQFIHLETAVYNVADLAPLDLTDGARIDRMKAIAASITDTVEPSSWKVNDPGGAGVISHLPDSAQFVITQTPDNQHKIEDLLEMLRRKIPIAEPASPATSPTSALPDHPSSPWKATLANGVVVELLGVADAPSKDRTWWRPDGSALAERPYNQPLSAKEFPHNNQKELEFVVRLSNLPKA
jgi:beta-lactamase regulating signal transducer with metallopeptidase domain